MFYLTEKGKRKLEEGKELSPAMEHLLREIGRHPGEIDWSPLPAMRAFQSKAEFLGLIRRR